MAILGRVKLARRKGSSSVAQRRGGAADAVEALGGHSSNRTVNEVVRDAKIIPGADNVLGTAEALSDSGATRKMRDGGETVKKRDGQLRSSQSRAGFR